MRLGYERIVKDKRISISIEESEEPLVTLKIEGCRDVSFKASDKMEYWGIEMKPDIRDEVKWISDAVHEAYMKSISESFTCFGR